MKVFATAIVALALNADAFAPPQGQAQSSTSLNSLEKYADELVATANAMVRPGRGLLACDESTGTVGSRLESIGLENVEENRRDVSSLVLVEGCDLTSKWFTQLFSRSDSRSGGSSYSDLPALATMFLEPFSSRKRSTRTRPMARRSWTCSSPRELSRASRLIPDSSPW